jgi:hypothetical protein
MQNTAQKIETASVHSDDSLTDTITDAQDEFRSGMFVYVPAGRPVANMMYS